MISAFISAGKRRQLLTPLGLFIDVTVSVFVNTLDSGLSFTESVYI